MLPCNHGFYCEDCWTDYVKTGIQDGKGCLALQCPTSKCEERLRLTDVRRFCPIGGVLAESYERFLTDSYVDDNPTLAWCRGPGCDRICRAPAPPASHVRCSCGTQWCFSCGEDPHLPVRCEIVKAWRLKNKDEGGDALWIVSNTKPCPKCKNNIEKNGGCMHMTCRPPGGCVYEFCWICMGAWRTHTQCNKYSAEEKPDGVEARAELQRYAHYYERFREHEKAQEYAATGHREKLASLAKSIMEAEDARAKDVEFMDAAVNEIVSGRCFLKWTYAYAYKLGLSWGSAHSQLFAFQQAQLEMTLERLSHIMEHMPWHTFVDRASGIERSVEGRRAEFVRVREEVLSLLATLRGAFSSLSATLTEED